MSSHSIQWGVLASLITVSFVWSVLQSFRFPFHCHIFVAIPYSTLLSVCSLFYNPFLSIKFEGLGGATKKHLHQQLPQLQQKVQQ